MKKEATKKAATKKEAPAKKPEKPAVATADPTPDPAPDPAPAPAKKSASPTKCTRPFRHGGRLYERGKIYDDVPSAVAKRFSHRFGDPKAD